MASVLSLGRPEKPESALDYSIQHLRPVLKVVLAGEGAQFLLTPESLVHILSMAKNAQVMLQDPRAGQFAPIHAQFGLTLGGVEDLYARAEAIAREYAASNGITLGPDLWA